MPSVSATIVGPRPAEPTMRVEHEVGVRLGDELDEPLGAGEHLALSPDLGRARGGIVVGQRDPAHAVRARLPHELLVRGARGQADDLELVARATTSSACVPIDPVEPRMRSRFIGDPLWQRLSKGPMKCRAACAAAGGRTT